MSRMQVHAFHGGGEMVPRGAIGIFADDPGKIEYIPYFFYLIEHPMGSVLFDTGTHPDMARDQVGYIGDEGADIDMRMNPEKDGVLEQLALIGKDPEEITHIILSHLHYDHAGGISFFPRVPVYVRRAELEYARNPPVYQAAYAPKDFEGEVEWVEVEGEQDLFGDGSVVMFSTPGHTLGHQSLRVKLDSHLVVLCADAAYTPWILERGLLPALIESPADVVETYDKLRSLQGEGAELIMAHDLDFETNTRVAPDGFYE